MAEVEDVEVAVFCANCKSKQRFMKRCTACKQVIYCSKECQLLHWPNHKPSCLEFRVTGSNVCTSSTGLQTSSLPSTLPSSENSHRAEMTNMGDTVEEYSNGLSCSKNIDNKTDGKNFKKRNRGSEEGSSTDNAVLSTKGTEVDTVKIYIKHNKVKSELMVSLTDKGSSILQIISDHLSIPVSKLKLIHRGKIATSDNVKDMLFNKALFLAFGEISESEDGLEQSDIDLIVKQLNVERNLAIKCLRKTGNVVDAIIEIGNM
ncbi:N-lysine methyltransferase SMYD2-B-like [Stylophora pistillata]|nr:N-lysine methyltransferase SMYD2-B-like [Stylophora pistillata]